MTQMIDGLRRLGCVALGLLATIAGSGFVGEAVAAPDKPDSAAVPEGQEATAPEATGPVVSQGGSFLSLDPFHAGLLLGSGVGWFTSQTTSSQSIGSVGPTLNAGLSLELFDLITTAISAGTIFVKDKASFKQGVVDNFGNTSEASSSTNITIVGLSAGLRTPNLCLYDYGDAKRWIVTNAYARYGVAWVSGSRIIENCKDCDSRPLSLNDGQFVESGVKLGIKRANTLGLAGVLGYRQYFAGASPAGEVQLAMEISYW
jgi:hypothetical protein